MNEFQIATPKTLAEASLAFAESGEARYLSGGMTLVPSMKARLASPDLLIDLSGIDEMQGIVARGDGLRIGAMARWVDIANSKAVRSMIPALARMAEKVADRHVRNRGTIGGSLANNDPAADAPAAALALRATMVTDRRRIAADDYFQGLFATALEPGEILVAIEVPRPLAAAYAKYAHPASGYAVAGVFAARTGSEWRIAVTGSGADGVFRLAKLEKLLISTDVRQALAALDLDAIEVLDDLAFPAAFRREVIRWLARDALGRIV